jgi:hypothetical protein
MGQAMNALQQGEQVYTTICRCRYVYGMQQDICSSLIHPEVGHAWLLADEGMMLVR